MPGPKDVGEGNALDRINLAMTEEQARLMLSAITVFQDLLTEALQDRLGDVPVLPCAPSPHPTQPGLRLVTEAGQAHPN